VRTARLSPTSSLIDYTVATTPDKLPAKALLAARDILLDTVGAMLGACAPRYSTARLIAAYARAEGGQPRSSVVGQGFKSGPSLAALANGTLAYALDIESIHGPSITHAAAVVVPAVLAVAEDAGRDGAEILAAVVVGMDAADRLSRALTPRAQYARGLHPSSIAGAPAAALAAANVLRLDESATRRALALATTQASGLMTWEDDPSENARPFNCGIIAARNGVTAALLAAGGFGGPDDPLECEGGYLGAFGGEHTRAEILADGLGHRFACCAFLLPGVDAILELRESLAVQPADVDEIALHFPRGGAPIIDGNPLRSHCAQYVLPVALTSGDVTFDDLAIDRRPQEPELVALSGRVRVIHSVDLDPEFPERYTSRVVLRTRDGRAGEALVIYPAGHPENPLTPNQLRAKFNRLAEKVVGAETALAIASSVLDLDAAPSVVPLMRLLACDPTCAS
jgi:2-methylcitrate dehydratase PrpD